MLTLYLGILGGISPSLSIDHDDLHLLANEEGPVHLDSLVSLHEQLKHLRLEVFVLLFDLGVVGHDASRSGQLLKILD